ncbi:MAG: cytochrome P450 [Novosphingobium sp.]|nr:cytochrome P450 [Novosphingobium sp.]MCP5403354.1 cytochrome P450 [Novosphingobium sp.]
MATAPAETVEKDYFTDLSVLLDPYEYFEQIRAHGPIYQMKSRDVVVVTGFQESIDILLNTRDFSSWLNPDPLAKLPFEITSDDISEQLDATSSTNIELMVSYDGEKHTTARSLLNPLFTPSRLKANEEFMRDYADEMVREMVAKGGCELINEVATPYVTMVIADLLGVPAEDREKFRAIIDSGPPPGNMNAGDEGQSVHPLMMMGSFFARYIAERRETPQDDVMTEMALAKYPDGSTPDAMEVVKSAMFLFAAGQDTSAKLIGNAMRRLTEDPELQQQLREDRSLIPGFLEEVLRLEGSTKATFRIAKRKTMIGDMEIPAGKRVVVSMSAANRDPRRWDDPNEFRIGRPKIKEHLAFGRGAHTCAGAPLARAEVAVIMDRFFEHTSSIDLSEQHHGPKGDRRIDYEPSYIIRGLANLHVELTPR